MAISPELVGRTYPAIEPYIVSREAVRAFAAAVSAQETSHTDPEAARALGHEDLIAPPTFAVLVAQHCDAQFVADPAAGVDYSRVVHGEQRFVHHRPLTAGDEVSATLTIDSIKQAGGHTMVTMRSDLATTGGEPVSTSLSTIVIRGGE